MNVHLAGANVVVGANQFNPSVFNPLWLAGCGLFAEEDLGPDSIFAGGIIQIENPRYSLLVLPNQLQFNPREDVENKQELIEQLVGGIVERLPHTPYFAVGLNFVWHLRDQDAETRQLARKLFFKEDVELYRRFDTNGAMFGGYLSRDLGGCREKLDIKPITVDDAGRPVAALQFAFNFHRDVMDDQEKVRRIQEALGRWNEFREESRQVVESIVPERDER